MSWHRTRYPGLNHAPCLQSFAIFGPTSAHFLLARHWRCTKGLQQHPTERNCIHKNNQTSIINLHGNMGFLAAHKWLQRVFQRVSYCLGGNEPSSPLGLHVWVSRRTWTYFHQGHTVKILTNVYLCAPMSTTIYPCLPQFRNFCLSATLWYCDIHWPRWFLRPLRSDAPYHGPLAALTLRPPVTQVLLPWIRSK